MAPLLDVDTWPELRDPILVVTLSGWVDAGMAGAGAVAVLTEQLEAKRACSDASTSPTSWISSRLAPPCTLSTACRG